MLNVCELILQLFLIIGYKVIAIIIVASFVPAGCPKSNWMENNLVKKYFFPIVKEMIFEVVVFKTMN